MSDFRRKTKAAAHGDGWLLLVSDPSAYMTNSVIAIDGGNLLSARDRARMTESPATKGSAQAEIDRSIRIHD